MVLLHSPSSLFFFCAALLLTGIGRLLSGRNGKSTGSTSARAFRSGGLLSGLLPYLGGFSQAAGTLAALYEEVPLQEILGMTLLLLGCASCGGEEVSS